MTEKRRLMAERIGYSSVVGGGVMLADEDGRGAFIISIIGTTQGVTKRENDEICEQLMKAIKERDGLLVSPRDE